MLPTSEGARRAAALIVWATLAGCAGADTAGAPASGAPGGNPDITVYLREDEALRVVFPEAAKVIADQLVLSREEARQVEGLLGFRLDQRAFTVHAGFALDGALDGYAVIQSEIGKYQPFDFIVGMEPDGRVRRVAVLAYRESRGFEVARPRFLVQYRGKKAADPIRTSRDILNVSGATMSVTAMNHGVKKALAAIEVAYLRRPDRVRRLAARDADEKYAARPPAPGAGSGAPGGSGGAPPAPIELREARSVMGAVCEIRVWGVDPAFLRRAIFAAFLEIERADEALSDYRPESEISALARAAGSEAIPVSELTARFLEIGIEIWRRSGGAFDMTVGPLVEAWGFRGGRGARPPRPEPRELEALRDIIGSDKVEIARRPGGAATARLERAGMRIDPGALGKGFAVDLAARRLRDLGIAAALVDFSGNMYALGAPPGREAWEVAVRDPARPERVLGTADLRDRAISSSGGYEKFVVIDGVRHGHTLSPRGLRPVAGVFGSTVIAPTAALADGWSTAACVLGAEAVAFLAREDGVEGMVVRAGDQGLPLTASTAGWALRPLAELPHVEGGS